MKYDMLYGKVVVIIYYMLNYMYTYTILLFIWRVYIVPTDERPDPSEWLTGGGIRQKQFTYNYILHNRVLCIYMYLYCI